MPNSNRYNIFTIFLFLLLFAIEIDAKEADWHTLKSVTTEYYGAYKSEDYHLHEDVVALEIRTYGSSDGYQKVKNIPIKIHTVPLKLLDKKISQRFRNAPPNLSTKDEIRNPPDFKGDKSRAFVLKKSGEVFRMNEISDVIGFLGEIDRPAEAYLVWWMHARYSGKKDTQKWESSYEPLVKSHQYRQTSQGYELLISYSIARSYGRNFEVCEDVQHFTDKIIIDKKGKMIYFQQTQKSKIQSSCETLRCGGPPMPHKKDPLEVLNEKE